MWICAVFFFGALGFAQTTLTFWAGDDEPGLEKLFRLYEQENPGVKLELEVVPYDSYTQKIVAAARTNTLPNVLLLQPKVPVTFAQRGVLEPVTALVEELGGTSEFSQRDLGFNTLEGEVWGVPLYTYPHVLFYRKSALDEAGLAAPQTWQDFKAVAEAVNREGMFGYLAFFNDPVAHTLHQWMATNDADTFDKDLNIVFDSANTLETLQFLKDLWKAGVIPPGATTYTQDEPRVSFINNQGAMIITSTSFLADIVEQAPELADDIGITHIPTNKGKLTYYSFRSIGIAKGSPNREASEAFIRWLFEADKLATYFATTTLGYMPMTRSLQESDAYWQSEAIAPYAPLIRPALEAARTGYFPGLNEQINPYAGLFETQGIYTDVLSDIIVDELEPSEAAARAVAKMEEVMGR